MALLAGQVAALLEAGDFEAAAALTTAIRAMHRPMPAELPADAPVGADVVDLAAERDRRRDGR